MAYDMNKCPTFGELNWRLKGAEYSSINENHTFDIEDQTIYHAILEDGLDGGGSLILNVNTEGIYRVGFINSVSALTVNTHALSSLEFYNQRTGIRATANLFAMGYKLLFFTAILTYHSIKYSYDLRVFDSYTGDRI